MRNYLTILFLLITYTLYGQDNYNIDLKFYDKSTGLQSQRINSIAQDTSGLLYMATETGITTYNGFKFEKILDFDSLSFYANHIHISNDNSLYLMRTDLLIPVSGTRQNLLNIEKVSLKDLQIKPIGTSFGEELSVDKLEPNLLQITNNENKSWIIDTTIQLQYNNLPYNFISKNRKVFGKTNFNSFSLENQDGKSIQIPKGGLRFLDNDVSSNHDLHFLLIKQSEVDVSHLGLYILKNNELSSIADLSDNTSSRAYFLMDKNDLIWVIRDYEILAYDIQANRFHDVHKIIENRWGKIRFYCHFKDHQKNIWIGTSAGLILAKSEKSKFNTVWQNENISSRGMHYWKDDKMLALTYSGIKKIDINTLETSGFNEGPQTIPGLINIIKVGDEFKVTSSSHDMYFFDENFVNSDTVRIDTNLYASYHISYPINVKDQFYILNKLGLYKNQNAITEKITLPDEIDLSTLTKVNQYYDEIFLSTKDKVYILDDLFSIKDKFELDAEFSFCTKDRQNNYWIASKKGLIKWNRQTNSHKIYSEREGFYNNDITALIVDEFNYLWIATYQGLYRFDTENETFSIFTSFDGLPNDEFNHHSNLVLPDGRIALGTIDGVCIFNPKDFIENKKQIEHIVHIQKIIAQNKDGKITELKPQNIIDFKSSDLEKRLTLWQPDFDNLSYLKFQYKLINERDSTLSSNWIVLNSNEIALGKKPYGNYKLQMQSINTKDGTASPIYTQAINYTKPFQYSWWFICSCLLLLGISILSYIKLRFRYLSRKNLRLEALVSERTNELEKSNETKNKLFAILAHDIRNPLAAFRNLSLKVAYLAERNQLDKIIDLSSSVDQKISGISSMLDNVLYWALAEKGNISVRPESVDMYDMILEVLILYEEMIEEKNISLINEIPTDYEIHADKAMMNIVFRNLLDNAIKYVEPGGTITIRREVSFTHYRIAILNTGTPINASTIKLLTGKNSIPVKQKLSKRSSGLGLTVCKELLALNNGELQLKSLQEAGTYTAMVIHKN